MCVCGGGGLSGKMTRAWLIDHQANFVFRRGVAHQLDVVEVMILVGFRWLHWWALLMHRHVGWGG